jgi:hypothetical protein
LLQIAPSPLDPGITEGHSPATCGEMAEEEGFEPPIPFQVRRFSRPMPSTTRPLFRYYQNITSVRNLLACNAAKIALEINLKSNSIQAATIITV